jgi:hypothetical protein
MKHIITTIAILLAFAVNAQVDYHNTTTNGTYSSAIGENNEADGTNAFVGGINSKAQGQNSFAFGGSAETHATNAFALGLSTKSNGVASFTIGKYITANGTDSYVIGKGITSSYRLINDIPNSLMIGINATKPTLFISQSYGLDRTGKVAIGNMTDPQAKLHIKGDTDDYTPEDADLLLEPGSPGNYARIKFGTTGNTMDAKDSENLNFHTASNFVFWESNVGIGTDMPEAKLQITDGDVFIESIDRGIIMKSPDGQCWRGTLDNNGNLNFTAIDCNLVTSYELQEEKTGLQIKVYPNPTRGSLSVEIDKNNETFDVQLLDIAGNMVLARKISGERIRIKTNKLAQGNYLLKVLNSQGKVIQTEKVVLIK